MAKQQTLIEGIAHQQQELAKNREELRQIASGTQRGSSSRTRCPGVCFKCRKPGHMARDCRSAGDGKGIGTCYFCGKPGHHQGECSAFKDEQVKVRCGQQWLLQYGPSGGEGSDWLCKIWQWQLRMSGWSCTNTRSEDGRHSNGVSGGHRQSSDNCHWKFLQRTFENIGCRCDWSQEVVGRQSGKWNWSTLQRIYQNIYGSLWHTCSE